ncbi:MAG: DUF3825 domain-containing protein [Thermoguttaceae bacterium]|nr:DUF3825 domain-containing protein [Thermoguttaceae bacterium]
MENQASAELTAAKARILAEIAALQTNADGVFDPKSWADFGALGSRLAKAGVAWKTCGLGSNFTAFMEAAFREEAERGEIAFQLNKAGANPNSRVRLTNAPPKKAVAASSVSEKKSTVAVKTPIPAPTSQAPKKLSDAEILKRVLTAIRELQTNENGGRDASAWVPYTRLGARLKEKGVDDKSAGFSTFAKFMETRFADKLEFDGAPGVRRTRPKTASTAVVPVAETPSTASTVPKKEAPGSVPQTPLSDAELEKRVLATLAAIQTDKSGKRDAAKWADFANLCSRLKEAGVDFKAFGYSTFAKFMEARFAEKCEFSGDSSTRRVRPKTSKGTKTQKGGATPTALPANAARPAAVGKLPNKNDAKLADWAVVAPERFDELAALALPEKWRFDDAEPAPGESRLPILESYIKYTFRQLAFEGKVEIAPAGDVAAFNVGLFDRKFDPIFAFFRKNVGAGPQPWRLSSFAVVAENADGKELVARFDPLPKRARFFERREDLVFDGDAAIHCDGEHCLVENVSRLPSVFLRRYCSPEFLALEIDGRTWTLDDVADQPEKTPERRRYFKALEKKLPGSSELFEMKLRFDAAVELAKKRVAANFRTAVPFFNPRKRNVCYLLPLTLTVRREAPERADVALVVERLPETGVYQGHTVYTLDTAYKTARLTARLGGENWLDG